MGTEHDCTAGQVTEEAVTANCTPLENQFYQLHFDVQRSIRYHQRRRAWFDGIHKAAVGLGALLGTATFYFVLQELPSAFALVAAAAVTVLCILDLVIGSTSMARLHHDLAREFIALDGKLRSVREETPGAYQRLWQERLAIESREPPIRVNLDRLCHNEQLRAEGRHTEGHCVPINWLQRLLAHMVDIGAHSNKKDKAAA